MDRRLVDAALSGNETTLNALIQDDPLILHRISLSAFNDTPLHMASLCGNLDFVIAILGRKPEFLTKADSFGRCPLHLACAEGHVEIVKTLFQACPEVAEKRDQDGRTPVELAALNEQVGVLTYLLQENPLLAKMDTISDNRETILHLCIRHNSIGALKLLVDCWGRDEVINSQDGDGNNLLHVAVIHKQIQTVKYLLDEIGFGENGNSINGNGFTAVDVLDYSPQCWTSLELRSILTKFGIRGAKELNNLNQSNNNLFVSQEAISIDGPMLPSSQLKKVWDFLRKARHHNFKNNTNLAEKIRGNLLVAATLIATISFQAGLNPPGGVWQDSSNGHIAGTSIIASTNSKSYFDFVLYNTISLVSSSGIILLMIGGLVLDSNVLMSILMLVMGLTVVLMLNTYEISLLYVLTPKDMLHHQGYKIQFFLELVSKSWTAVIIIVTLFYIVLFLMWLLRKITSVVINGIGLNY